MEREVILYCKKYRKLLEEEELKKRNCLCKFRHQGKCGICPNVIDLLTNKPYYKVLFSDNGSDKEEDYWTRRNKEWRSFIDGLKKLDPSDMFRESESRLHKPKKEDFQIKE
ncbi:MAG: hypothetical protein DRP00_04440 [Candidatus Aenigmatarchaeota archaeon]|nr:MAG: hypothetical protein DRP00_04440 [Candidatus Aenigmarchaeota archaeon]